MALLARLLLANKPFSPLSPSLIIRECASKIVGLARSSYKLGEYDVIIAHLFYDNINVYAMLAPKVFNYCYFVYTRTMKDRLKGKRKRGKLILANLLNEA